MLSVQVGKRHGLLDQARVQRRAERKDLVVEVVAAVVQEAAAFAALADAQVGAGLGLQHEGEILGAHAGLHVAHDVVGAHQALGHVGREIGLARRC